MCEQITNVITRFAAAQVVLDRQRHELWPQTPPNVAYLRTSWSHPHVQGLLSPVVESDLYRPGQVVLMSSGHLAGAIRFAAANLRFVTKHCC